MQIPRGGLWFGKQLAPRSMETRKLAVFQNHIVAIGGCNRGQRERGNRGNDRRFAVIGRVARQRCR